MEGFFFVYYNMKQQIDPIDLSVECAMRIFVSYWKVIHDSDETEPYIIEQFKRSVIGSGYKWEDFTHYIHATYETGFIDCLIEPMVSIKTPEEWFQHMKDDFDIIVRTYFQCGKDPILAMADALENYTHKHFDDQTEVILV